MIKRKIFNLCVFAISLFVLEGLSLVFMGFNFFIYYFLLELTIIILLGSIIFFFNNTMFDRIYLSTLLVLSTLVLIVNTLYYIATGNVFSLLNIGAAKQLTFQIAITYIVPKVLIVLLIVLGFSLFIIIFCNAYFKVEKSNKNEGRKNRIFFTSIGLIFGICIYIGSSDLVTKYDSNIELNYTSDAVCEAPSYNFRRYGMFSYYIKEIQYLFRDEQANYNDLKNFYLSERRPKDNFTGVCKDMNVISIMIESGGREMVNKTLTPTLYSLINEGINFKHNYQKQSTGVSEIIGITGNYPICSSYTTNINCETPFSLPSLLNKENYTTIFCHDVDSSVDLYNRLDIIPKLGFKKCYFHNQLYKSGEPCWTWDNFSLDTENTSLLLENLKSEISNKFYLHYTTLTMHPNYTYKVGDSYAKKLNNLYLSSLTEAKKNGTYKNPFEGTSHSIDAPSFDLYMMKCMDFDKSLEQIINFLKDNNLINNTILLLYGDHDVYGLGNNGIALSHIYRNIYDQKNINLFDTVMTMYNPFLIETYYNYFGKTTFDFFTSANNILPSLLDLLGVSYSPRMYFGQSVFDHNYNINQPMFSYALGNYINMNYLSEIGNKIDRIFNDNGSQKEFLTSCYELYQRKGKINTIYKTNFFSKNNFEDFILK